ncbi:hypothetical protein [Streptomyces flavidovirens]
MGKRERRRRRQRAKEAARHRPKPIVRDFPEGPSAVIRVVVPPEAASDLAELCFRYWERTSTGRWAYSVSELGGHAVPRAVSGACAAVLLNVPCSTCGEPAEVANRSEAAVVGGPMLDDPLRGRACPSCKRAARERRDEEQRLEQERRQRAAEEAARRSALLEQKITLALTQHRGMRLPDPLPRIDAVSTLVYEAMACHVLSQPGTPVPALKELGDLAWTGSPAQDGEALMRLRGHRLIAFDESSDRSCFALDEDDGLLYNIHGIRWRLVADEGQIKASVAALLNAVVTEHGPTADQRRRALASLVEAMDIDEVVDYLDGLLTVEYGYGPVPQSRRTELHETIRHGLGAGYTPGQMNCFAWRAADTAAGWKERHQASEGQAASAVVTILRSKIDDAQERRWAIPEYDRRYWQQSPPAHSHGRALVAEVRRVISEEAIRRCSACDGEGLTDAGTERALCRHLPTSRYSRKSIPTPEVRGTPSAEAAMTRQSECIGPSV